MVCLPHTGPPGPATAALTRTATSRVSPAGISSPLGDASAQTGDHTVSQAAPFGASTVVAQSTHVMDARPALWTETGAVTYNHVTDPAGTNAPRSVSV